MDRKTRRTPEEIRDVAYHEAGHAVVYAVLGLTVGHATIVRENIDGRGIVEGSVTTYGRNMSDLPWCMTEQEKARILRSDAVAAVAGAQAVHIFLDQTWPDGIEDDYATAYAAASSFYEDERGQIKFIEKCERAARDILLRHRDLVEVVAAKLLKDREIFDFDELLGDHFRTDNPSMMDDRNFSKRVLSSGKFPQDSYVICNLWGGSRIL